MMKAIVYTAKNEVTFKDFPDPKAGPDEVIVAVKVSGICHTDYEVLKDNYGTGAFPVVPGHEYAGVVIEVGVNVPNASVMVIESAERFGLSQLHQLRGRVGRGAEQSFCILMTGKKMSNEGRKRMEIMVRTNDGFEIAEEDLRLRGPGDMMGTQQSGILDLKYNPLLRSFKKCSKFK